ncbi:hypothetical protein [Streptacidiphilus albus]|uniref:hypothetical protein n=1 Tax=Streptacidiphilus albus TaxID=105425 RepID=UPI000A700B45|nr:hypothetical protein [Streptacidiphilus albus]
MRIRTSRMTRRLLLLAALPTALAVVLPGTAMAASAGDPSVGTPACDTQSVSEHDNISMYDPSDGAYMGTAYLVYSSGCQTEWVTVHAVGTYDPEPSVWLQNRTGTDLYETNTSGDPQGTYWTYQLGDMRDQTACGGVQMYNDLNGAYVNWNYIGCY